MLRFAPKKLTQTALNAAEIFVKIIASTFYSEIMNSFYSLYHSTIK
jgi:hypothetical protein